MAFSVVDPLRCCWVGEVVGHRRKTTAHYSVRRRHPPIDQPIELLRQPTRLSF